MSKKIDEFRMPAEWEPQKSVWMSWPHNKNDWPGLFEKIPSCLLYTSPSPRDRG